MRSNTPPNIYTISFRIISSTDNIRDHGILNNSKLIFRANINNIIHKAYVWLSYALAQETKILTRAYCTYDRPVLVYCSPVWSPHNNQLDKDRHQISVAKGYKLTEVIRP